MYNAWRWRGEEGGGHRARSLSHEANSSIEYGEKTWTTAQTVRDLMQNHLDAETERYYESVALSLFSKESLAKLCAADSPVKQQTEDLLYKAFLYAKHSGDMTDESRLSSVEHLRELSKDLPLRPEVTREGVFQPSAFHSLTSDKKEEPPYVAYDLFDAHENKPIGWVPHDTLASEPIYKQRERHVIQGMKVVDHGSGFDSQLSSLFLSSKTGKRHVRGKFGEGAKMSELHLLRGGASLKLRSEYQIETPDKGKRSRVWQVRPSVTEEGRMIAKGVELERETSQQTGSTLTISLRNAKESFRDEFIQNVDPRTGGLGVNVVEFSPHEFVYPMPLTSEFLSGVDMQGSGERQFVQGLRVELAKDSFGYETPWYSYNFLDSNVIAGRDRSELTGVIEKRISSFWQLCDNPALLEQLVRDAVHGGKERGPFSIELTALNRVLNYTPATVRGRIEDELDYLFSLDDPEYTPPPSPHTELDAAHDEELRARQQSIVDAALAQELDLQPGIPTFVTAKDERDAREAHIQEVFQYARRNEFRVLKISNELAGIESFGQRLGPEYELYGLNGVQHLVQSERAAIRGKREPETVQDDPRQESFKELFNQALEGVNELARAAGMKPITLELDFRTSRRQRHWEDAHKDWDNNEYRSLFPKESNPVQIQAGMGPSLIATVDLNELNYYVESENKSSIETRLALYLLAGLDFRWQSESSALKQSQQVLDQLITKLLPEDGELLHSIPRDTGYAKNPEFLRRIVGSLADEEDQERVRQGVAVSLYERATAPDLTCAEAEAILTESGAPGNSNYRIRGEIGKRIFSENGALVSYDFETNSWKNVELNESAKVAEWATFPVYRLDSERYFIPAPMPQGAVLSRGEGKRREYFFRDEAGYLHIGERVRRVTHASYDSIALQPSGITFMSRGRDRTPYLSEAEKISAQLSEYTYYPQGLKAREGKIVPGIQETSIPIEYGRDEWDKPVRVFQDIVQNHIDAAGEGIPVLTYEVLRDGESHWVTEEELVAQDVIQGFSVADSGDGYYPNDIAVLGTSSKRSPLFAGKYGEGQKMVAAAALRNGLEVGYEACVRDGTETRAWKANATLVEKEVVLGGQPVNKQIVAFDVTPSEGAEPGARTVLRLGANSNTSQKEQWDMWLSIIDPRKKDENGHAGLARYVRQLRKPGQERVVSVGSVNVLLDEPGAVYENGLRINEEAEEQRPLAFGYDVPEVVTTRERNSYNAERLASYAHYALSRVRDQGVIAEVLQRVANGTRGTDLDIDSLVGSETPIDLWASEARRIWPGKLVHSSERVREMINPSMDFGDDHMGYRAEDKRKGRRIEANMVHIDPAMVLDVPKKGYRGLAALLPTTEDAIRRLETELLPISENVRSLLTGVVDRSVDIFRETLAEATATRTPGEMRSFPLRAEHISEASSWGVGVAPISSAFHGKVDHGVVFNEQLLLPEHRRDLAETAVHEVAHILTGYRDYTEPFVRTLYEVARFLAKKQ